jgi:hypothetical protein
MKAVIHKPVASNRKVTPAAGSVVTPSQFDKVTYVGKRIRASAVAKKVIGKSVPKADRMQSAVLVVKGDKPGYLAHRVKWDGNDMYIREFPNGAIKIGSVKALNETGHKGFSAEVLSMADFVKRVAKVNRAVKVTNTEDDTEHTVYLLNPISDPYIAGVEIENGKAKVVNMEPVAHYNSGKKGFIRFSNPVDVKVNVAKAVGAARV